MKHLSIFLLGMFCFICNSIFADEIPNNEIWYEANAKLKQTTDYKSSGIYTSAFDVPIVSHTFANGKGVIQFNDEVKKIGFAAFMNCSELTSISVPNSVTEYGYWILNGCNKIRSIQISKSVKKIEAGAFSGCGGVGIINVESGNPNYDSRNNCNAIIETKSNTLLAGCKNTIIPNSVAAISSEAFYGCYDLKNITIPNSVKRIGYNAFKGCTSLPIIGSIRYADTNLIEVTDNTLSSYSIKEGTRFIGHQAFKDCINLTNISIPHSVIRIESGAFEGCSSLPVIDNIRYADKYLVEVTDNKLSSYTIQDGTLVVGSRAFEGCWNMTSISIPNSVEIIDEQAFSMCHSLSDVTFSTSLNTIGDDAFNGCDFNSLRIPNTVTNIGSRAFAQCFRLTDIYIPESVTKIGDGAFSSNESLSTIVVDPNNPIYNSRDNCNAIIETATNTIIAASTNTLIPKSVTAIGNEAYERRAELTSFTIPDNITVIGDRAFSECWNLEEVNIPNSVTSLGEGAFFFCESLKDIEIPNSVKGTIDEMFCYCRNLQSVTLSSGISYICGRAFTDCKNLTDLYCNAIVPPTIEDDWAFRNVPSNMKIHVPAVSIDLYKAAKYWKNYEIVPDIYDKHQQVIVLEDWEVLKRFHDASVLQGEWTRNAWSMENGRGETADESLERLPGVSLVDGHVRSIDLSQSGLTGDVLSLAGLSELEYLDLSGNAIANVELPLVSETATANLRNQTLTDKKDIVWDSPTEQSLTENLPNIMRLAADARSLAEQYTWTLWNAPTATGWRMSLVMKDAMPELRQLSSRIYDNTNGGSTTLQVDAGIAAGSTLPVQFHYLEGDANLSGTVDVLDVQTVVNESFGIGSSWLNKQAADLQADGSINVLDLVHVVNVLLSQEMPSETAANRHMANSSAAQMGNVFLHCQDGQLLMESTERVSALDLWLRLPQRSTENEVKNLLMGFDMATRQSGNLCHIVLYSPMGMEMEGMGKALLSLPQGSTLLRASAADAEACHMTVALSHQTTHITEGHIDTPAEPVYDLQGRISTARGLHISKQHGRYTKSLTK